MQAYTFLSPQQSRALRAQRVQELEKEHYMGLLSLEEDPNDQVAQLAVAEMQRRIEHHMEILTDFMPGQQDEETAQSPEAPPEDKAR